MNEHKYIAQLINEANKTAVDRLLSIQPIVVDVDSALNVIPGMTPQTILHSGPPITWKRMCDPMKRAVKGALILEGLAKDDKSAERLMKSKKITLSPNNHHGSIGPMTGIVSASMPVIVTKDQTYGNTSYSTFNEGGGKVLWFGSVEKETIQRLRFIRDEFAPVMKKVIKKMGGLAVWSVLAQGIQMGDECHNRHAASTNIFLKTIVETLFSLNISKKNAISAYKFIAGNSHFFLNFSMTACKLAMVAASGIKNSTIVTTMSRNGTDFGIRVSGLGDKWFIAPSPLLLDALYNPGYGLEDGAPDIGDSSIIETMGLGGFAIAAAPSMASFAGGGFQDSVKITKQMGHITSTKNPKFGIPCLDFEGTPTGIDIRKVVETEILPSINSAVVHKSSGAGQIGAGIVHAPYECFTKAIMEFGKQYKLAA